MRANLLVECFQQELERSDGTELVEIGEGLGHGLEEGEPHGIGHLGLEELDEDLVGRQLVQDAAQELAGDGAHLARNVEIAPDLPRVRRAAGQSEEPISL